MALKNWKVTAFLCSPLAGEPPMLDAIIEWELAKRLGYLRANKLTRDVSIDQIERPPIPVARKSLEGGEVYQCSSPILPRERAEWVEHANYRIETNIAALALRESERKSLLVASGPYKMRHAPIRVRLINSVSWFVRGARKEINKLLKPIVSIGKYRRYGYGIVDRWEFEEQENNYAIFADSGASAVLMRPIPLGAVAGSNVSGYRRHYGACDSPYWHPDRYMDIAVPV